MSCRLRKGIQFPSGEGSKRSLPERLPTVTGADLIRSAPSYVQSICFLASVIVFAAVALHGVKAFVLLVCAEA